MIFRFALLLVLCVGVACTPQPKNKKYLREEGHYWQRANVSSAIHMRGPKAQQRLNQDLSRCVVEIRELTGLNAIRQITPAERGGYADAPDPDAPAGKLAKWDTPSHEGALRAEHLPYHDVETCMQDKGWERAEYLPYDTAEQARDSYIETVTGQPPRDMSRPRPQPHKEEGDWEGLNE